jgi:very-short-patch-repair endonuclease
MSKKITTDIFIERSKIIHGDKYDYSLVNYEKSLTKVTIICPTHGEFTQTPNSHLNKNGCPKCANNVKLTTEEFIERSKIIHDDKYDYSKVVYKNNSTKVIIICPTHGEFNQKPNSHLNNNGCPKCANNVKLTTEEFIEKSKMVHDDKYDYSKVVYKTHKSKIKIICPTHGEFNQSANAHLSGKGCPKCGITSASNKLSLSTEEFIEKAKMVHDDKYGYDKVVYKNNNTKVVINCPTHGDFTQTPYKHLKCQGCRSCNTSKGEKTISDYLKNKNIFFITEHSFDDCIFVNKLRFDFYLPHHNICIEYDGIQHFEPHFSDYNGDDFILTKKRDNIKNEYCFKNHINLIRIKYDSNIKEELDKLFLNF